MRSRVIPASLLIGVVAFEAVGLVTLHRLGSVPGLTIDWSNLGTWLELTAAEDAVVAVVRLIALGVAYWLAFATAVGHGEISDRCPDCRPQVVESAAVAVGGAQRGVPTRTYCSAREAGTAWMEHANCLGCDPELFFPERGESISEARAVCAGCAVRPECLEFALAIGEKQGIWGGLSEREGRRLRRQRARDPWERVGVGVSDLSGDTMLLGLMVAIVLGVVALVSIGRWWRRCLLLIGFALAVALDELGPIITGSAMLAVVLAGVGWRLGWPGSFRRVVVRRVRASQRRCWYRQYWTNVMV